MTNDQDGNLTSDGRFNYTWDGENRLMVMQAVTPAVGDKQYEFMYDYMGRRAIAFISHYDGSIYVYDASEWYLYDGWNVVMVVNMNDTAVLRKYTWGLDLSNSIHGAGGIGGLLAAVDTQGTPLTTEDDKSYWYLYDGNGNVGQLLRYKTSPSESVTLAAHYEYDPYGSSVLRDANGVILAGIDADPVNDAGAAAANPFRFSTKWLIDQPEPAPTANTIQPSYDLYYFGYRYYSPWLGRWMSRDPIEEQGGPNLHAFTMNGPAFRVDPNGRIVPLILGPIAGTLWGDCLCCALQSGGLTDVNPQRKKDKRLAALSEADWDAVQHCIGACEVAVKCGATCATNAGILYELGQLVGVAWGEKSGSESEGRGDAWRDTRNDAVGANLALSKGSDCTNNCLATLKAGGLYVKPPAPPPARNPVLPDFPLIPGLTG